MRECWEESVGFISSVDTPDDKISDDKGVQLHHVPSDLVILHRVL